MTNSGLDPYFKDLVQVLAWLAATIGGLIAAFKALREVRESRHLRSEELRWRKAELARKLMAEFRVNAKAQSAITILDWTGRPFQVAPNKLEPITWGDMHRALRITDVMSFNEKETYIRDCFDALFDSIEEIEHLLRTKLIEFDDVDFPLRYYVTKLQIFHGIMGPFLSRYGFYRAQAFIGRFPPLDLEKLSPNERQIAMGADPGVIALAKTSQPEQADCQHSEARELNKETANQGAAQEG